MYKRQALVRALLLADEDPGLVLVQFAGVEVGEVVADAAEVGLLGQALALVVDGVGVEAVPGPVQSLRALLRAVLVVRDRETNCAGNLKKEEKKSGLKTLRGREKISSSKLSAHSVGIISISITFCC